MKLLKIDNENILTPVDKNTKVLIKILLACSVAVIGCELYILLNL